MIWLITCEDIDLNQKLLLNLSIGINVLVCATTGSNSAIFEFSEIEAFFLEVYLQSLTWF